MDALVDGGVMNVSTLLSTTVIDTWIFQSLRKNAETGIHRQVQKLCFTSRKRAYQAQRGRGEYMDAPLYLGS